MDQGLTRTFNHFPPKRLTPRRQIINNVPSIRLSDRGSANRGDRMNVSTHAVLADAKSQPMRMGVIYIGRKPILAASCTIFLLLSYPLVWVILHGGSFALSVAMQAFLSANCGFFIGSMAAALVEMFPTKRRLTGLSTSYNLASMIFGGFAPFIATWLISRTHSPLSVTYYVIFGAAVSLPAVLAFRETA